tara:strand:+ start:249 stop:455 length:207 start_codon:yes stop_codon:yes gene_type:complete
MKRLSYNNWMRYIYNSLHSKPVKKIEYSFGEIGNRSELEIQEEIAYLRKLDTDISNKLRTSYTITNEN